MSMRTIQIPTLRKGESITIYRGERRWVVNIESADDTTLASVARVNLSTALFAAKVRIGTLQTRIGKT